MNYFANPYQGYGSPYGYPSAAPQGAAAALQAFGGQVTRVNGRNGAEAFRMAPNSSILLMDENDPIVWLKQTDGAGYATVTPYTVTPYQAAAPVDVSVTVAPTAAGTVTVTLVKDGVPIPGATVSAAAAAGAPTVLSFPALVRQPCCAAGAALTLVLSGVEATVDNVALRVQRI